MNKGSKYVALFLALMLGFSLCNPGLAYAAYEYGVGTVAIAAKAGGKNDAFAKVKACEGKTADDARKAARRSDIDATFEDSFGVDVTEDVEDKKNGSKVHDAIVIEVKTHDRWIFGKSVTFVLDYTDPAAKKERKQKAAKEKKKLALKELKVSEGKRARQVVRLAKRAGVEATFFDKKGNDVTKEVHKKGTKARNAKVIEVKRRFYLSVIR